MRAVRKYYGAKPVHVAGSDVVQPTDAKSTFVEVAEFPRRDNNSDNNLAHAFFDLLLGHVMANLVFGATFFAALGLYDVSVQKRFFEFFENDLKLGKDTPILLPWVMSLFAIFLASLEFIIRNRKVVLTQYFKQKDTSKDVSVHTPFPKISPYSRQAATAGIILLLMLQTLNGVANVEPDKLNPVYEDMSKRWHKDHLAMFMGQLCLIALMGIVDKASGIVSSLWEKATTCCRDSHAYEPAPEEPTV